MRVGKPWFFIVALITAAIVYVTFFGFSTFIGSSEVAVKSIKEMRFGIDIKGGVEAYFQSADASKKPTIDELNSARAIIETRLDSKNILDRDVTVDKDRGVILVRFPWKTGETEFNPQKAIAELGETAKLTFVDPDGNIVIEGKHVVKATPEYNQQDGSVYVKLNLNAEGATLFETATGKYVGKPITIKMDETVISSPKVEEKISGGEARISGSFTSDEAKALAEKINAGALPFALVSKSNSNISPTLGTNALGVMVKAAVLAFILICLFMLFYYRLPGFVACIALAMQVCTQLLIFSIFQYTITLPGIAGIILSIGMGVDANVIISERIKEELRGGKTLGGSIEAGFKRAFSAVADGNVTVMIVAVLLWIFGSGSMLSFGISLFTGVVLNFVTGVTASRLMIKSLSNFKFLRNTFLYGNRRSVS